MSLKPGKTFKRVGGLSLLIFMLAACGNDAATVAPTAPPAPTTAAITTAAATSSTSAAASTTTSTSATGTADVTSGPAATATTAPTATPAPTSTPVPTATPTATSTPVPSPTATPLGGATNTVTSAYTGATASAKGDLKDKDGKTLGSVVLMQSSSGVKVVLTYTGVPAGDHGIHFHAVGQCVAPDFTSAGAHFNPENKKHGLLATDGPHAGDLPDLIAAASGSGTYDVTTNLLTLKDGPDALFGAYGASLVLTADPDDQKTDPNGNSGARIGCAVLTPDFNVTAPGAYTAVAPTPAATPSGTPGGTLTPRVTPTP